MDRDHYTDLGLTQYATNAEIKAAFHTLAKQHHPDKTGSADTSAFRCIRDAFEKLTDATFKREYDANYHNIKMRVNANHGPKQTRTAAYEAEAARETQDEERLAAEMYQEMLRRSPPPKEPTRKAGESGTAYFLGRAYQAYVKRDEAYRKKHPMYDQAYSEAAASAPSTKAHGLTVKMSSHPSTTQRCTLRTVDWRQQIAGSDVCVFCLLTTENGCRCPGCEALACQTCLSQIVTIERSSTFSGFSSKAQYRASGG